MLVHTQALWLQQSWDHLFRKVNLTHFYQSSNHLAKSVMLWGHVPEASLVPRPHPSSYEEKDLVIIDCFLGCAELASFPISSSKQLFLALSIAYIGNQGKAWVNLHDVK